MDCPVEDLDELNEETFGSAEAGDWEFEHERFAVSQGLAENRAPEADELPKFWEAPGDLSFLWQPDSLDVYKNLLEDEGKERGVDVEETIQKLVAEDDAFEDPAILDISKKVSAQKLYGYTLEKILDAPAYPTAPVSILGNARDIWSSSDLPNSSVQHGPSETTRRVSDSLSLLHILQQMGRSKVPTVGSRHSQINSTAAILENVRFLTEHSELPQHAVSSRSPGVYADPVLRPAQTQSFYDLPRKEVALISSVNSERLPSPATGSPTTPEQSYDKVSQSNQLKGVSFQRSVAPPVRLNFHPGQFLHPRTFTPDVRCATLQRMVLTTGSQPNGSPTFPFHEGVNIFQDHRSLQHLPAPGAAGLRAQSPFQIPTRMQFLHQPPIPSMFFDQRLARPSPVLFAPQPGSRTAASFETIPRVPNVSTQFGVKDAKFGIDLQSDEQFDPTSGSWMTQYESVGVLLSQLRPLMVSNPYVQDYYFAVRWLRRMNTNHTKQLLSGGSPPYTCPPVMQIPSPVTFQNLIDPTTHYHDVTLTRKFVMPFALVHSLNRPPSLNSSVLFEPVDGHIPPTDELSESQSNSKSSPAHALSGHVDVISSALGRVTRSNLHHPRIVAELSLSSALVENIAVHGQKQKKMNEDSNGDCVVAEAVLVSQPSNQSISVIAVRRRRLLLARIERMFSLILNLDEVDVSLARVIVDNEMRTRLLLYRQSLVERLTRELFQSTDYAFWFIQTQSPQSSLGLASSESSCCELLTIRKGVQLFSSVSKYIPLASLKICLRELVLKFDEVFAAGTSFTKEYHTQLYPSLRHAIYQMTDMEAFMLSCFPEATESLLSVDSVGPNVKAIITSQVSNVVLLCDMICSTISLSILT
ncbi:hypothetical protein P879_08866 [Paragonimus westermani]|uniref:Uncharacterized protein n=1 Tax=Paragonimus westermani TaxID=34504 RepID=A0A8T0DJ69_9TREM|nr:hypothetical protein P879_08866 [Paragonimus westermani]